MNPFVPFAALAATVYGMRLAGLLLPENLLPARFRHGLTFVPVAVLSALTVSGLSVQNAGGEARVLAVLVGGLVAFRTRQMWACIAGGLAIYLLFRLAGFAD